MKPKVLYVLISMREESTDDYTVREHYLHGIFTGKEIKKYRHLKSTCYIVPLNKFIESGMRL
jgi:hypothetical protein